MSRISRYLIGVCAFLTAAVVIAANAPDMRLTRGFILRGNSSGIAAMFDANDSGKLLIGDGTDLTSATLTGAVTVNGTGVTTLGTDIAENNAITSYAAHTSIDFTTENEAAIFATTTGAIKTAVNAQLDYFWAGSPFKHYFSIKQGVGATGANTLLAAVGLTPAPNGWLLTCDNTATDSIELGEGSITLGSARSRVTGTSAAFTIKVAILVPTRASVTHFGVGYRKLVAYETANTYAEYQTAYDEKAGIGFDDNAGTFSTETSKATVNASTPLAHVQNVDGDLMALQVLVSSGGVVTYKLATVTPAGSTAAQLQAAVTAAYAALATDASAVAFTFTAATVVVPYILLGASGAAAPDLRLVNYYAGLQ